ncbi:class I SAM-dependent methyltransferase [Mycobacterium paraterrae]|uniref:Class I SAM-dependent methyltransferase n=1 Tax=Mycobacterium paraterrae TaxID=577492 RepID=A0ABY3VFI9_9MYCO|nr:class I SAM-dependent methyltransferase [Mycobacterium paraterrae]UMB68184.1 class I SAM-dependent methyltransferase [Mycobacterium paraterrae]
MAMNLLHQRRCSSEGWADAVRDDLLPWALAGIELGEATLEIGPGYGATLRALLDRAGSVTAVEVDQPMAERLMRLYGDRARVLHGDGGDTGLPDRAFDSVVCFTMLHHVPTVHLQDRLFAEAFRVLRPGGVFAGSDRVGSLVFRLIHIGDTYNPVRPDDLQARLTRAGFSDVRVDVAGVRLRWRAIKPN